MANALPLENVPGSSTDESGKEEKCYEAKQTQGFDEGYVAPQQDVNCEGLAILEGENYNGFKNLNVDMARLHFQHELPPGYIITERIGRGAFGCCFLVEKQTDELRTEDRHVVLKVIRGKFKPRRPVLFYKTCKEYTIMISYRAKPLALTNLKFIVGMLKFLHTKHAEVHGNLNSGNMMYFIKDLTRELCRGVKDVWSAEEVKGFPQAIQTHVMFDFIDHWISMEDEQIACIIDADIGGKIGEAKFVVNHQHHDPRNATWQVSDDMIGLMNWIVLKSGHKIKSHPSQRIEYAISLESLKRLHAYIMDMYRGLNPDIIFKHPVDAPEEPFTLELEPGECYLDELLEGEFLQVVPFKGSYSVIFNQ